MAKRLFQSCRSPSAAAAVTPTTTLLPTTHPTVVAASTAACCPRRVPRQRPARPPAACGAGGCAVDYGADDLPPARGTPAYRWLKSSRWHVIEAAHACASDGDGHGDDAPRLKIDARRRVRRSRRRRRLRCRRAAGAAASWSSGDSGWFSTDDDGEPFGAGSLQVASSTTTTTESSSTAASGSGAGAGAARGEESAAAATLAVAGGFAVVKRSDDPRADFRRSMAEMVVGRGIYDADGLERLLRCFLALNHRRHRRHIVDAFGDVWEAVFADPPGAAAASASAAASSHGGTSCKAAAAVPHRY
ncbi:hypothetical protein U9M48_006463 [Paspalum notatum var. saurae]|uniref:Transcription repressor n=1 Tax=Paspalum notatum var. saurae TaxID=547442 RepID=A0AAQ3PPH7_PASNO